MKEQAEKRMKFRGEARAIADELLKLVIERLEKESDELQNHAVSMLLTELQQLLRKPEGKHP